MSCPLFFKLKIRLFQNEEKNTIDKIRTFIQDNYKDNLKQRSSLHEYIYRSSDTLQRLISSIRHSPQIKKDICSHYQSCPLITLDKTDELYISHYNIDGGGDQGLYEKHYDGILRFITDATIVRALIYINSKDKFVVHFLTSNVSHHFSNNEYGLLDFNREYHWVEGKYNHTMDYQDSRILLKINYLVCPSCSTLYTNFIIFLNHIVFVIVKTSMEYSKSPETPFQHVIGFFCNLFRIANNRSVYCTGLLSLCLGMFLYKLACMMNTLVYYLSKRRFYKFYRYIE